MHISIRSTFPFVLTHKVYLDLSVHPFVLKMSVEPIPYIMVVIRRGSILHKQKVSCICPFANNKPGLFVEHIQVPCTIHCVSEWRRANDLWRSEPTPHSSFGRSLHFFNRVLWVVLCPVITVMLIYKTFNMKYGLFTLQYNVAKQVRPLIAPPETCCKCHATITIVKEKFLLVLRFPWFASGDTFLNILWSA